MPRNHKKSSSNGNPSATNRKLKEKPTYKIIVLGSGGVGKVSLVFIHSKYLVFDNREKRRSNFLSVLLFNSKGKYYIIMQ
jgi:hypothetical protein